MRSLNLYLMLHGFAAALPLTNDEHQGFDKMRMLSNDIAKLAETSIVRNELNECKPVTVIFARGTVEPGNVGTLAGPPFFNALDLAIGKPNVGIQGVDYPATILGYLQGGDSEGAMTVARLIEQAASSCPLTQIVLSGYSQGAQVIHNGAAQISEAVASRVVAVVLFGDPFRGQLLPNIPASRVKTYCFIQDRICQNTIIVDASHFAYGINAASAALFVKSHINL